MGAETHSSRRQTPTAWVSQLVSFFGSVWIASRVRKRSALSPNLPFASAFLIVILSYSSPVPFNISPQDQLQLIWAFKRRQQVNMQRPYLQVTLSYPPRIAPGVYPSTVFKTLSTTVTADPYCR